MGIEKLKKIVVVSKKEAKEKVLDELYNLGAVHIESFDYVLSEYKYFEKSSPVESYSQEISKINYIKGIFKEFGFSKKGFFQSFFPEDVSVTKEEYDDITGNFDLDKYYDEVSYLYGRFNDVISEEQKRNDERQEILSLKSFPYELAILKGTKKTFSIVGRIKNADLAVLGKDYQDLLSRGLLYVFESDKNFSKVFLLFLKEDKFAVEEMLGKLRFDYLKLKGAFIGFVEEEVSRISVRLNELKKEREIIVSKLKELSKSFVKLQVLEDYYASLAEKEEAITNFIESKSVVVSKGFFRVRDESKIYSAFGEEDHSVFILDPEPDDFVPVALKNNVVFRPFEFLIRLFGVPSYGNIDPTPIVALLFSVFFGIALGDAFYGLILAIFGGFFAFKYHKKIPARNFFMIMLYGGITSTIVGLLTGSFGGNFFNTYFPSLLITKALSRIQIIDTNSPSGSMNYLIFAIGLGVFAQLLGVLVSVIVKLRQKDFWNALFNGIGWLLFLPGLILLFFIKSFPQLKLMNNIILYTGLVFLLLGGWISIRSFFFKPIAAIVNLYGIRSSYGIASFLGDALSYSRLFALGLSSSILASSFNLMARAISNMFGSFGIVPLIIILLVTHGLTLVINVLGAFIHSIRLNFLEFFGRFYEIGSYEFKPLGLNFKNIRIDEKKEAK